MQLPFSHDAPVCRYRCLNFAGPKLLKRGLWFSLLDYNSKSTVWNLLLQTIPSCRFMLWFCCGNVWNTLISSALPCRFLFCCPVSAVRNACFTNRACQLTSSFSHLKSKVEGSSLGQDSKLTTPSAAEHDPHSVVGFCMRNCMSFASAFCSLFGFNLWQYGEGDKHWAVGWAISTGLKPAMRSLTGFSVLTSLYMQSCISYGC